MTVLEFDKLSAVLLAAGFVLGQYLKGTKIHAAALRELGESR